MKKLLFAALIVGGAVPASSAPFVGNFTFDITTYKLGPPDVITHPGPRSIEVFGSTPGLLDSGSFFGMDGCHACISYVVAGDLVTFTRLNPPFRGTMGFTVQFDKDLGGDLANAVGANPISGGLSMNLFGQFVVFNYATGKLIEGWTAAVPEPASWAMMIGGFALAGAAMRRRGALRYA